MTVIGQQQWGCSSHYGEQFQEEDTLSRRASLLGVTHTNPWSVITCSAFSEGGYPPFQGRHDCLYYTHKEGAFIGRECSVLFYSYSLYLFHLMRNVNIIFHPHSIRDGELVFWRWLVFSSLPFLLLFFLSHRTAGSSIGVCFLLGLRPGY